MDRPPRQAGTLTRGAEGGRLCRRRLVLGALRHTLLRRAADDLYLALANPHDAFVFIYRGIEWLKQGLSLSWDEFAQLVDIPLRELKELTKLANVETGVRHASRSGSKMRPDTPVDGTWALCRRRQHQCSSSQRRSSVPHDCRRRTSKRMHARPNSTPSGIDHPWRAPRRRSRPPRPHRPRPRLAIRPSIGRLCPRRLHRRPQPRIRGFRHGGRRVAWRVSVMRNAGTLCRITRYA